MACVDSPKNFEVSEQFLGEMFNLVGILMYKPAPYNHLKCVSIVINLCKRFCRGHKRVYKFLKESLVIAYMVRISLLVSRLYVIVSKTAWRRFTIEICKMD